MSTEEDVRWLERYAGPPENNINGFSRSERIAYSKPPPPSFHSPKLFENSGIPLPDQFSAASKELTVSSDDRHAEIPYDAMTRRR